MDEKFWIGGYHAVISAYKNKQRKIYNIFSTKEISVLKKYNLKIVSAKQINKLFEKYPNFKHQNIAAEIGVIKNSILKEDISHCKNLIILDDVKDINNIGSIIRSVSAFNFDGIIVEKRNLNLKNPAIYKTSVGEIENIKLFQVSNISNAIEILKKNNFWIYGMDINGEELLNNFSNFNEKKAIIFGSEESGISRNVLKNCDYKIRINMSKKVESLNISNVAAITLAYFFNLKK